MIERFASFSSSGADRPLDGLKVKDEISDEETHHPEHAAAGPLHSSAAVLKSCAEKAACRQTSVVMTGKPARLWAACLEKELGEVLESHPDEMADATHG